MGISAINGAIPYIQFVPEKFRNIINDVVLRLSYFSINPFATVLHWNIVIEQDPTPNMYTLCVNSLWRLKLLWRFMFEQRHLDMFLEEKGFLLKTR